MTDTPPLLTVDGPRATVTLNRPAARNRLDHADLTALPDALHRAAATPGVRVIVLTGAGDGPFSAGYNFADFDKLEGADGNAFEAMIQAIARVPKPLLCALNGPVYGGAVELALACDIRIATPALKARVPPAALGLHYHVSGLQRFVAALGPGPAQRLLLTGETMAAAELHRIGFVGQIVPPDELAAAVDVAVDRICRLAPLAVDGMTQCLREIAAGTLDPATAAARVRATLDSADLQEGLAAIGEKRTPDFKGA